jgi:hypothetical protein
MGALAEVAASARTQDELRRDVLARLQRSIGLDFGIVWTVPERLDGATLVGFSPSFWPKYFAQRERYRSDLAPMVAATERLGGVANDRDAFDRRARERLGLTRRSSGPSGRATA